MSSLVSMSMLSEELQSSPQNDDSSTIRDEHDREAELGAELAAEGTHPPLEMIGRRKSATPPDFDSSTKSPSGDDEQASDAMNHASGALERKHRGPQDSNGAHAPRKRSRENNNNTNLDHDATAAAAAATPIPILCTHRSRDVFEVVRARGKSLASGGFGFVAAGRPSCTKPAPECSAPSEGQSVERDNTEDGTLSHVQSLVAHSLPAAVTEHLFLEEVLFLHERGLLECRDSTDATSGSSTSNPDTASDHAPAVPLAWDAFRLYSMLNRDDTVSLPVYLVYAHLRKQGFRVVRHTPNRRALLEEQQQGEHISATSADGDGEGRGASRSSDQRRRQRQLLLREDAANAVPPALFALAWDVYQPNSQFRRARPGLPDFCAAVATYNAPMRMQRVLELVDECRGIPLQIGTVSPSGQVVMMGVHDFAAPCIDRS